MVEMHYKCACQKEEQTLFILPRLPDETLEHYMTYFQQQISIHHNNSSPKCRRTTMEYAKIYVPPSGIIGGGETLQ